MRLFEFAPYEVTYKGDPFDVNKAGWKEFNDTKRPRLLWTHLQKMRKKKDEAAKAREEHLAFLPTMYGDLSDDLTESASRTYQAMELTQAIYEYEKQQSLDKIKPRDRPKAYF